MPRIAILHYTTSPHIGGIETLIDCQRRALCSLGFQPRLITGSGERPLPVETVHVPLLLPAHPDIVAATEQLAPSLPGLNHPLVKRLREDVENVLEGFDECWVHNALTLHINPFLTVALQQLMLQRPGFRWVIWCHDFSTSSIIEKEAFPNATYVTLSHSRRLELSAFLSVPEERIQVVPPAIDPDWLGLTSEAKQIASCLQFGAADPVIVVPSKLLAHKNLHLTVRVAAALQELSSRPLLLLTAVDSPHHPDCAALIRDQIESLLRELDLWNVVHLLSGPDRSHLEAGTLRDVFRLSDLLLLPSINEGFGMPLWEAAALRVPVLCSDIPAFREVGGDAVSYFPLDASATSIARQALKISRSPQNQARRRALYSFEAFQLQLQQLLNRPNPSA